MNARNAKEITGFIPREFRIERLISGGQTGVDRAALDVAIELAIPHGGWCPRGRRAEDGVIPDRYQLQEWLSENYADRTRQNVLDSNGTLILYGNRLEGGSLLTANFAEQNGIANFRVRLSGRVSFVACIEWLVEANIRILNVAGPRASKDPNIYDKSKRFLRQLLG
ncbi:MAG: putative molybdenum carrier protein [Pirellulaceae bacterium]|nr:putative molybdenum carrier protein [Pirellulaceae bacterium]